MWCSGYADVLIDVGVQEKIVIGPVNLPDLDHLVAETNGPFCALRVERLVGLEIDPFLNRYTTCEIEYTKDVISDREQGLQGAIKNEGGYKSTGLASLGVNIVTHIPVWCRVGLVV